MDLRYLRNFLEEWRPVIGYEGMYAVSNQGRVKAVKRTILDSKNVTRVYQEKLLFTRISNAGYQRVVLCKHNKAKAFSIHRLVAQSFLNSDNHTKPHVNHKDGNKLNNACWNVEWVSPSENSRHMYYVLGKRHLSDVRPVNLLNKRLEIVKRFASRQEATIYCNSKSGSVTWALQNGNFHKGYYWDYA